ELFETLPEVGDPDKPKMVFFFDEAHLLFDDAPKALLDKVEQVARLIRSKGVGVYFVTQNPADVPDDILGQLGNRVQHALRAFTPKDQKALRLAADTFRANPAFKTAEAITQVGVGEALVSVLETKGMPSVVERTLIRPPSSQLGPITDTERRAVIAGSPLHGRYETPVDRESAEEILKARAQKAAADAARAEAAENAAENAPGPMAEAPPSRQFSHARRYDGGAGGGYRRTPASKSSRRDSVGQAFAKSFARQLGTKAGQSLMRGVLGSLFKGR
ncbi:MAG: helicase HerA-like domain-containing protein, partial [Pseudomonadota bacterium]